MLALMAARAGASRVVTCEQDAVLAALAREIIALNGFGERVAIVRKRAQALEVGVDLDRPADLLFCDIFSDNMLGFTPLGVLADARQRLLAPGAPVVPRAGVIRLALANWTGYSSTCQMGGNAGFDLSPMATFLPETFGIGTGSPALTLLSRDADAFRFDFSARQHPSSDRRVILLESLTDGSANGIVQWIRLELDDETAFEIRPEQGSAFWLASQFHPLPREVRLQRHDVVEVQIEHDGTQVTIWT